MTEQVKCGCGRSVTGFCDGSHKLTNEQYQTKLREQLIKEQNNQVFLAEDTRD
jgi:CDGSH-type Zn-finger protein